jgi:adenylate cyclase
VEAAVAFQKAFALDPNCYEANQLYAEFFPTNADFEQAAQHYLRTMEIQPDDY